jgi:hypothetical protein
MPLARQSTLFACDSPKYDHTDPGQIATFWLWDGDSTHQRSANTISQSIFYRPIIRISASKLERKETKKLANSQEVEEQQEQNNCKYGHQNLKHTHIHSTEWNERLIKELLTWRCLAIPEEATALIAELAAPFAAISLALKYIYRKKEKGFQWKLFCVLCSTKKPRPPPLFIIHNKAHFTRQPFFLGWPLGVSRSRNYTAFFASRFQLYAC